MNQGPLDEAGTGESSPAPLVLCAGLTKTFGSGTTLVRAVREVDCVVRPGDRIAVTGPSGSGKSTLLHLMAGLEEATAGTITWPGFGGRPSGQPGLLGLVFQGPSLLPALDVLENVELPLLLAGKDDAFARRMAIEALELLGIGEFRSKLPEELSGGQAQRVAIARVLAGRPVLILADEPTGQLDSATGAHVIDVLLLAATSSGAALVISTHDPEVSARLDHEWSMREGIIARQTSKAGRP